MRQIIDYSLARPDPAQIAAKGYVGVMRYVAPSIDEPKVISLAEYRALRAHGLQVGLNWEWYGWRAREGATSGTSDASAALRQAIALGYTGAIYFSVDYDAPESDQANINAYFQACAQILGKARLGAYGGYWPLSRLFDAQLITFGWQTDAWSGANRESRAHLFQTGATDMGDCDVDDVEKSNWAGGAPPVNYIKQQAEAVWASSHVLADTGIFNAWLEKYEAGIVCGPPLGNEFSTTDWQGFPIVMQWFGSGIRIEYYVQAQTGIPAGTHHGYTATSKLW